MPINNSTLKHNVRQIFVVICGAIGIIASYSPQDSAKSDSGFPDLDKVPQFVDQSQGKSVQYDTSVHIDYQHWADRNPAWITSPPTSTDCDRYVSGRAKFGYTDQFLTDCRTASIQKGMTQMRPLQVSPQEVSSGPSDCLRPECTINETDEAQYKERLADYQARQSICEGKLSLDCIPPEPPDTATHKVDRALWEQQYGTLSQSPDMGNPLADTLTPVSSKSAVVASAPLQDQSITDPTPDPSKAAIRQLLDNNPGPLSGNDTKAAIQAELDEIPSGSDAVQAYRRLYDEAVNSAKGQYAAQQREIDHLDAVRQQKIAAIAEAGARLEAETAQQDQKQASAAAQAQYQANLAAYRQQQAAVAALQQRQASLQAQQAADQEQNDQNLSSFSAFLGGLLGAVGSAHGGYGGSFPRLPQVKIGPTPEPIRNSTPNCVPHGYGSCGVQ